MIHLTPEGLATALAALVVIAAFMAAHAKRQRTARARAKYVRGEQDREVQRIKADILETINCDLRRLS